MLSFSEFDFKLAVHISDKFKTTLYALPCGLSNIIYLMPF